MVGISLMRLKNICELLGESSDTLIFGAAKNGDSGSMARRIERLTPAQYDIADGIMTKLMEAF